MRVFAVRQKNFKGHAKDFFRRRVIHRARRRADAESPPRPVNNSGIAISRTPRRWRVFRERIEPPKVLECGRPLPLSSGDSRADIFNLTRGKASAVFFLKYVR